eukprot:symbB.v1.2.011387.t1/scaffold760.1/size164708/8
MASTYPICIAKASPRNTGDASSSSEAYQAKLTEEMDMSSRRPVLAMSLPFSWMYDPPRGSFAYWMADVPPWLYIMWPRCPSSRWPYTQDRLQALQAAAKLQESGSNSEPRSAKPQEAAAAALAASVAFFRRAAPRRRESLTPARPRGFLLLLRDAVPQVSLSLLCFVVANALPKVVLALLIASAVFVSSNPRVKATKGSASEDSNVGENTGDVAEVSLLNIAVQEMWPEITSFIRTVLKETVEEAIQTRMPWFLSSLGFGRISFGDAALKVEQLLDVGLEGLNVERLAQESYKEGEMRSFKVSSLVAWDADVDVNLTAPMAAISAEHVLVKGRLDVCLQQILPRPPFFTGITFYFAELPKVSLTLDGTLMGLRVSLLWLERILADIIQKQLAEQIVLPTVAAVLLDITNDDAWFEAGNMFPEGVCTVVIHEAEDLAAKDLALPFGLSQPSSDPYCEVTLGTSHWRTPVRPQNLNPKWSPPEATQQFLVHSRSEQQLQLHLYDENPYTEDVSLGVVSLPISDLSALGLEDDLAEHGLEIRRRMPLSEQGFVTFSASWSELKLDESNLRLQLRSLDDGFSPRPAFVVLIGIDCCTFMDSKDGKDRDKSRGYFCKTSCEEHEEVFKSRSARKKGRYGATAWWRRSPEPSAGAESESDEDQEMEKNTANFQATFTHLIQGDPRSAVCHLKVERSGALPVGKDVGEIDFPVYRLISARANTTKVVLPLGPAKLSVLAQLRATT